MQFSTALLYKEIKRLTHDDAIKIGLNELTYYKLKDDPKYIHKTQSNTLIKILEYTSSLVNKTIVGIDVNTKNFLTVSDTDLNITYSSDINVNHLYNDNKTKMKLKKEQLHTTACAIVNDLLDMFKHHDNPIVYVIGDFNAYSSDLWNHHHKVIINHLKKHIRDKDSLFMIDEHKTSRTCPHCGFISRSNRKHDNSFECANCGFKHKNDDIVAAKNIATRFEAGYPAIKLK